MADTKPTTSLGILCVGSGVKSCSVRCDTACDKRWMGRIFLRTTHTISSSINGKNSNIGHTLAHAERDAKSSRYSVSCITKILPASVSCT